MLYLKKLVAFSLLMVGYQYCFAGYSSKLQDNYEALKMSTHITELAINKKISVFSNRFDKAVLNIIKSQKKIAVLEVFSYIMRANIKNGLAEHQETNAVYEKSWLIAVKAISEFSGCESLASLNAIYSDELNPTDKEYVNSHRLTVLKKISNKKQKCIAVVQSDF